MEQIKFKAVCKELNGSTTTSEVTFASNNDIDFVNSQSGPTVEVEDIDSTGATAGQVPTATGSGTTIWADIDLSEYAKTSFVNTFAKSLLISVDTQTNIMTATLKDADGNTLGTPQTLDLGAITPIVDGYYDSDTSSIVFELNNGNTITVPLSGIIDGFLAMSVVDECFTEIDLPE